MELISILVAALATLASHFHHRVVLSNGATQKNDTGDSLLNMLPISVQILRKGVTNLIAGGSGGNNDGPPPDYRPGRWQLFPSFDFDPLLWYDLQWDQEEQFSLFPKQWYEDEELVYAWNSISGGWKEKQIVDEVS